MWSRNVVVVLMAALGCGGEAHTDGGVPGSDPGGSPRCNAIENDLRAALVTRGTCETGGDCKLVAGPAYDSCDGEFSLISCGGVAFELNAPGLASAESLTREFFAAHCDAGRHGAQDCAPSELRCGADHHCIGLDRSCLPPPPDAAVDAGVDAHPDASIDASIDAAR